MPLHTDLTESNRERAHATDAMEPGGVTGLYQVDPIRDPRWSEFLQRHPRASVFHTPAWLEALRRTYGYEPIGYTSSPPGQEIRNGLVFCRINSWLMGRRMVSLPFSDHCEPLFNTGEELEFFVTGLQAEVKPQKWNYLEVRPLTGIFDLIGQESGFRPARRYLLHGIDLQPDLDQILRGFDKDSVVRRIQRAERAGLIEKCGTSLDLLKDFYNLLVLTRGRHDLPPQPREWFQNLIDCLGDALEMRIAYKEETPVAAILTLRFRDVVLYKYGCSDARFKYLAGMPLLLWGAIKEAKSTGAREFSLGRSDEDNVGLVTFKNHWTLHATSLIYWRYPGPASLETREGWRVSMVKRVFAVMPQRILTATGRFIYRHIG
jgi:hypothetical protein